jgi:hypothetical protein
MPRLRCAMDSGLNSGPGMPATPRPPTRRGPILRVILPRCNCLKRRRGGLPCPQTLNGVDLCWPPPCLFRCCFMPSCNPILDWILECSFPISLLGTTGCTERFLLHQHHFSDASGNISLVEGSSKGVTAIFVPSHRVSHPVLPNPLFNGLPATHRTPDYRTGDHRYCRVQGSDRISGLTRGHNLSAVSSGACDGLYVQPEIAMKDEGVLDRP